MTEPIEFHKPTDGQVAALARILRMGNNVEQHSREELLDAMVRAEDIVLSLVADQTKVPQIREELALGKRELRPMFTAAIAMLADDETPAPKKAVRRGRPRKSA